MRIELLNAVSTLSDTRTVTWVGLITPDKSYPVHCNAMDEDDCVVDIVHGVPVLVCVYVYVPDPPFAVIVYSGEVCVLVPINDPVG